MQTKFSHKNDLSSNDLSWVHKKWEQRMYSVIWSDIFFPIRIEEKLLNFFKTENSGLIKNTPTIEASKNMEGNHTRFPWTNKTSNNIHTPHECRQKNNINDSLREQQKYWFYNTST